MRNDILYLVIPCYNEEAVLPETSSRLTDKMNDMINQQNISALSRVLFVDDGSKDNTWQLITDLHKENPLFSGLKLAHNEGHQNALVAGLMAAREQADIVISLDADLQDDINVIDKFVEEFEQGCDIVYGVRSSRTKDTVFKRSTAVGYYKFLKLMGVEIVENHADYRLMTKRALDALAEYDEVNLFLRGIVPLIGFRTAVVPYERSERFAGESKYPLKKMLSFAIDGITSFSVKPIRLITWLGFLIFFLSAIGMIWILALKLTGATVAGWATQMGSIWALGGIQLVCLGILGEYIGKIYKEVKHRPRFIVDRYLNDTKTGV